MVMQKTKEIKTCWKNREIGMVVLTLSCLGIWVSYFFQFEEWVHLHILVTQTQNFKCEDIFSHVYEMGSSVNMQ